MPTFKTDALRLVSNVQLACTRARAHTHTHTYFHKGNFKEPGARRSTGAHLVYKHMLSGSLSVLSNEQLTTRIIFEQNKLWNS